MAAKIKPRKRTKKSSFVPEVFIRGAIVGVIPACALVACGGATSTGDDGGGGDGGADVFRGVAAVGFPAYDASQDAADAGSDAADTGTTDAKKDVFFGVAAVGFAFEAGKG